MTTKGKTWKWTEEQKAAAKGKRGGKVGNTNGVKHGLSRTRAYNSWKKMMMRCYRPEHPDYEGYGGRGIFVVQRWHDVRNFYEDMGEREKNYSIERLDVNGHYGPSNCLWIPLEWQSKNRRPWKHTPEGKAAIAAARKKAVDG